MRIVAMAEIPRDLSKFNPITLLFCTNNNATTAVSAKTMPSQRCQPFKRYR